MLFAVFKMVQYLLFSDRSHFKLCRSGHRCLDIGRILQRKSQEMVYVGGGFHDSSLSTLRGG